MNMVEPGGFATRASVLNLSYRRHPIQRTATPSRPFNMSADIFPTLPSLEIPRKASLFYLSIEYELPLTFMSQQ